MYKLSLFFLLFIAACAEKGINLAPVATQNNFVQQNIFSDPFVLTTWVKKQQTSDEVVSSHPHIYIEGDGRAFTNNGHTISPNPTPVKEPAGFKLAMADPHPYVIYLARPCQFTPVEDNPTCNNNRWWSSHRYDITILQTINNTINTLSPTGEPKELIGYSGGATLALLLAATRTDIASVRTVAGNVAPHLVNRIHGVRPTPSALSPLQHMEKLADVPQIHFTGGKDSIITPEITRSYFNELPHPRCTRHINVEAASHHKGWVAKWPALLQEEPACENVD